MRTNERSRRIANRVLYRRKARHWSQKDLAEESGLSAMEISRIERAQNFPRMDTLEKLAKAFGCKITDLIG